MDAPNPYAPPNATVADADRAGADIDALDVSESWKKRFRLIRRAGGPGMPHAKDLSFGERSRIMFNVLAFLFGPVYYLFKGMWRKALTLFVSVTAVVFVIALILELNGLGEYSRSLAYGAAAFFGIRANVDYYKKMVLREDGWW